MSRASYIRLHTSVRKQKYGVAHFSLLSSHTTQFPFLHVESNCVQTYTILYSTYTLKCRGESHLDITECAGTYCASSVFICILIHFHNVCLSYIYFLLLSMNRNICFSMHRKSLRAVVIKASHLAQAHLHSVDTLFERHNHIIQIHVFVYKYIIWTRSIIGSLGLQPSIWARVKRFDNKYRPVKVGSVTHWLLVVQTTGME